MEIPVTQAQVETEPKASQEPRESRKLENQPELTTESRNVSTSQPLDEDELRDNLSAADSSLEKPKGQDA